MGSYRFQNQKIKWTKDYLIKLQALKDKYKQQEEDLGNAIQKIINFTNVQNINKSSDYIKIFYRQIMAQGRTRHYNPYGPTEGQKITQTENAAQALVDKLTVNAPANSIASMIDWKSVGINEMLQTLKKDVPNIKYKLGDYSELDTLQQMALGGKALENRLNQLNKNSSYRIDVEDTEKYSGSNIHKQWEYDIKVTMTKTDNITGAQRILDQYFEVKRGISPSYLRSHFKMGDISSKGLSIPGNQAFYHDFIVSIQQEFKNFLETKRINANNIDATLGKLIQNIAYSYIEWRLSLHLLIFVSDTGDRINLGSEIITGLMEKPGTYLDIVFDDLLSFIDITLLSKGTRIVGDMGDMNQRYVEAWNGYDWSTVSGRPWRRIFNELQNYINSDKMLIPKFKATISYGPL